MTLKPKVGKLYVRRDGGVSDPLIKSTYDNCEMYPVLDPKTGTTYLCQGREYRMTDTVADLIREYKPAKPEWRVVIKCESRKKARTVKGNLQGWLYMDKITVEKSS